MRFPTIQEYLPFSGIGLIAHVSTYLPRDFKECRGDFFAALTCTERRWRVAWRRQCFLPQQPAVASLLHPCLWAVVYRHRGGRDLGAIESSSASSTYRRWKIRKMRSSWRERSRRLCARKRTVLCKRSVLLGKNRSVGNFFREIRVTRLRKSESSKRFEWAARTGKT